MIHNYSSPSALSHIEAAAVLEALGQPVLVLDADGCVTYASSDARRLLGTPMERLRGRPFHHLFAESRQLHAEVLRLLHEAPAGNCVISVTEIASAGRVLKARLSVIDDAENLPHMLVHLSIPRSSRRNPTAGQGVQKLPETAANMIFAA